MPKPARGAEQHDQCLGTRFSAVPAALYFSMKALAQGLVLLGVVSHSPIDARGSAQLQHGLSRAGEFSGQNAADLGLRNVGDVLQLALAFALRTAPFLNCLPDLPGSIRRHYFSFTAVIHAHTVV